MARILILDDEPKFSTSLQGLLEGLGHEVSLAKSVPDVLESHLEAPPELLICDLVLPGPEPMAAVTALRAKAADLVVIAVSGFFDEVRAARFMEQVVPLDFSTSRLISTSFWSCFESRLVILLMKRKGVANLTSAQGSSPRQVSPRFGSSCSGFGSVVTVSSDRG